MVNTLMTNYINVKNHLSHTNTQRAILSQWPEGRSFVCVYGLKCCWQVKINPTLLLSFSLPFLAVHFSLLFSSPGYLFPSFMQPYFHFLLFFPVSFLWLPLCVYPELSCFPCVCYALLNTLTLPTLRVDCFAVHSFYLSLQIQNSPVITLMTYSV